MSRPIKHFSLHRIAGTELRVISDVEDGVLPVIDAEEVVIRGYAQQGHWPHRWVTLFILQDLQPLVRQLRSVAELPPGGAEALEQRPVVNVYDLAELSGCQVFVNWQAMAKEGYWDDPVIIRALLAHEHAHPLVEGRTTRASRRLEVELSVQAEERQGEIHNLLDMLARKLCLDAPREVFANEMTIRGGFGDALLHLNRRNMANARISVAGREDVRRQLRQEVAGGTLLPASADLLLLIGDLQGYLDLALETAPFYRAGREQDARELETVLETEVFPCLEPEVSRGYAALREQYIALQPNLTQGKLIEWSEGVLNILVETLTKKGLNLGYRLRIAQA